MSSDLDNWETDYFEDTDHQSSMVIANTNGTNSVHIVRTGSGPTYHYSSDDGYTWTAGVDIDGSCNFSTDISFVKDGSIYYTAYYDSSLEQLNASIYDGSWSAQVVDTDSAYGGTDGRKCSIDASGNLVFVSYALDNGGLALAKSTTGGATWNTDK
jgi:hypothetical protein